MGQRLFRHQASTDMGAPFCHSSDSRGCLDSESFLSPTIHICVGLLLSSLLLRPCIELLSLSQETMCRASDRSSYTRPARLVLGTGMMLPAASLIHTTCVSPDMRGRSIFDSCRLLHLLHRDRSMPRSAAMSITAVRRYIPESVETLTFHTPFTQEHAHRNLTITP